MKNWTEDSPKREGMSKNKRDTREWYRSGGRKRRVRSDRYKNRR